MVKNSPLQNNPGSSMEINNINAIKATSGFAYNVHSTNINQKSSDNSHISNEIINNVTAVGKNKQLLEH